MAFASPFAEIRRRAESCRVAARLGAQPRRRETNEKKAVKGVLPSSTQCSRAISLSFFVDYEKDTPSRGAATRRLPRIRP